MALPSTQFTDSLKAFHILNLNLPPIKRNHPFLGKRRKGADGIGGGHIGEIGQVFTGKIDFKSSSVLFKSIGVFQKYQGFSKSSPDMFIR